MPDLPVNGAISDILTPQVASILREAGDEAYRRLVVDGPVRAPARVLSGVVPADLIARPIKHPDDAVAGLAGLWLWHDALDGCHRIVQDIASPTASFWHAIMHRREGDFSNSKYWYHRCATHHVIRQMGAIAASTAGALASDSLVTPALSDGWNPDGFVDLVQRMHSKPSDPRHELAIRLQRLEWEGLFCYCVREAVEADHDDLDNWASRVLHPSA